MFRLFVGSLTATACIGTQEEERFFKLVLEAAMIMYEMFANFVFLASAHDGGWPALILAVWTSPDSVCSQFSVFNMHVGLCVETTLTKKLTLLA